MPRTKKPSTPKRQSYVARSGRTPIGVTVNEEEHDLIRRAAEIDSRPKSQFVLKAALEAAKKILAETEKNL